MAENTYRITTLGCRVNRADSLGIERDFARFGYRPARRGENPELWVVNTCAVTAEGSRKSRKAVRKCTQSGARVVVTGCASEMDRAAFEGEHGVDMVVPNRDKHRLASSISRAGDPGEAAVPWVPTGLARVPVKVQDGCRRYCSYCVVPYLRGELVCRDLSSVLEEVGALAGAGVGEAIICGIDLGGYRDPESGDGLERLVREIIRVAGGMWIRLSSLELYDISDGLLELLKEDDCLCKHLHLPLQSGDGGVLSDMGRMYSPEAFYEKVEYIRRAVPGIAVTTDVMVGFPTESEAAFENTRSLLSDIGFSRVHVFRYSPRPGTAAFALGDPVETAIKKRRSAELRKLTSASAERFNAALVGRIIPVLVEGNMESEPGHVFARAESFAGVVMKGDGALVGRKVRARMISAAAEGFRGETTDGQRCSVGQGG